MSYAVGGQPHLSVVVPAYNEERRIAFTASRIVEFLGDRGPTFEILVVDDGSIDTTADVARKALGAKGRVLSYRENRGKGFAVREGVLASRGRWVLVTDADLSTPVEEYDRLAAVVRDRDLDVAIGSRGLPDSRVEQHQAWVRETMGKGFNRIVRVLTGLPYRDTQCGFKLFDRRRVLPLFERMVIDGFAFDVELLFLCHRFGLTVAEVPVVWRNVPDSRVRLLQAPPRMILDLLRIRWRFRRGGYNPETADAGNGAG